MALAASALVADGARVAVVAAKAVGRREDTGAGLATVGCAGQAVASYLLDTFAQSGRAVIALGTAVTVVAGTGTDRLEGTTLDRIALINRARIAVVTSQHFSSDTSAIDARVVERANVAVAARAILGDGDTLRADATL